MRSEGRCSIRLLVSVAIGLWVLVLLYIASSGITVSSRDVAAADARDCTNDALVEKLEQAIADIDKLRDQNAELRKLAEQHKSLIWRSQRELKQSRDSAMSIGAVSKKRPESEGLYSKEHEVMRREIDDGIRELFFYLADQAENKEINLGKVGKHALDQVSSLLAISSNFSYVDNSNQWRVNSLASLTSRIQKAIEKVQNPEDCSSARILTCNLNKGCGFGCQLHHVAYCFVVAFGTNRTLVLQGDGKEWRYSEKGWSSVFKPVTRCSYQEALNGVRPAQWESEVANAKDRVVFLPIVDGLSGRPPYLPLSFPRQFADELQKLHANPPVFFISQFIWYLMRSTDNLENALTEASKKIPFDKGPVVGLQIRRTDKIGTEAAFHELSEYIKWTEHWFRIEATRRGAPLQKRIFIATDDPSVVKEARDKYKDYEVYADVKIAETAQMANRYTDGSLLGVITDIRMLSQCEYLVCTFSSQVCRMGFELMQVLKGDAGHKFHSLDDLYYYGGQFAHEQVVVMPYSWESPGEIDIEVGDVIGVAGNHWNGFSKGTNRRTGKVGLYPSYKVRELWRIVDFPPMLATAMKRSLDDELALFDSELSSVAGSGPSSTTSGPSSSYSAVPAKRPAPVAGPIIPQSHISAANAGATVVVPPQLRNAGVIESAPTIYKSGDERASASASSTSVLDSSYKTMALPSDVEMLAAKKQATKALENSYLGQVMRGEKKMKRFVRTGGGQTWEDPSLAEWDPNDFRIFCGDLGNEVSDELLAKAFRKYPSFQKAKVVRDHRTNKSKGYGFVSFRLQDDFVRACREMDGKYVGNRPIKLRKSLWRDRNIEVVKKKQKQKEKLGLA